MFDEKNIPNFDTEVKNYPTPLEGARELVKCGFSVFPLTRNGKKEPAIFAWNPYRKSFPTPEELADWFNPTSPWGIATVMGHISGNAEAIDFDDMGAWEMFQDALQDTDPELYSRLVITKTPRPGVQVLYRCSEITGNKVLARRGKKALIETRGEGGYVVGVGSPKATHANNALYEFELGSYGRVQTITKDERQLLWSICRSICESPRVEQGESEERVRPVADDGHLRPGDDYNDRGDIEELLEKYEWKCLRLDNHGSLWQRPGVDATGHSARLFKDGTLFCFSSNVEEFEVRKPYSPFAIYATLEHEGNYSAAASALVKQGFGHSLKEDETIPEGNESPERQQAISQHYDAILLLIWSLAEKLDVGASLSKSGFYLIKVLLAEYGYEKTASPIVMSSASIAERMNVSQRTVSDCRGELNTWQQKLGKAVGLSSGLALFLNPVNRWDSSGAIYTEYSLPVAQLIVRIAELAPVGTKREELKEMVHSEFASLFDGGLPRMKVRAAQKRTLDSLTKQGCSILRNVVVTHSADMGMEFALDKIIEGMSATFSEETVRHLYERMTEKFSNPFDSMRPTVTLDTEE
jgi:bifunctional DNA primase/polymerase-like protein